MPESDLIGMTIRKEAARNEKILAWLRFGLVLAVLPDFLMQPIEAGELGADIVALIYLVAALLATYQWASRLWFKYLIVTTDAAIALVLTLLSSDIIGSETNFLLMALCGCFVVVTACIRLSRWAVAYATALAMTDLAIAFLYYRVSFSIAIGTGILMGLLGCLSYFVMARLLALIEDVTHKEQLARFLPPELVEHAAHDPALLQLGGKRQSVTILFADIRGFTPMSATHPPEEVIGFLNDYFRVTTEVIFRHRGTLDKYMGDALMALFGAPLGHPDDADRAVKAAIEIMDRVAEFNKERGASGFCPIGIGIGINTSEVIAGNIGTDRRMDYTVIGDGVNIAARLEKLTKKYDTKIVISGATYENLTDKFNAIPYGQVAVEGRDAPVQVFGVPHVALGAP